MGRKSRARAEAEIAIGKFELSEFMRHEPLFNQRLYEEQCFNYVLQTIEEQKRDRIIASLNKTVKNDETAADVRSVEESEASISSKNDEEKALKRKLKKERQKEKKNCAKQMMDGATDKKNETLDNNCDPCEPEIPAMATTITFATVIKEQKHEPPAADNNDDNSESENNDDNDTGNSDNIDFAIDAPVVPAFVQSMIHTKNNTIKMMKKANDNNKIKDTNLMSDQMSIADNSDGFTSVKKVTFKNSTLIRHSLFSYYIKKMHAPICHYNVRSFGNLVFELYSRSVWISKFFQSSIFRVQTLIEKSCICFFSKNETQYGSCMKIIDFFVAKIPSFLSKRLWHKNWKKTSV